MLTYLLLILAILPVSTAFILITNKRPSYIIFAQIGYCSFVKLFISMGVPNYASYVTDALTLWLCIRTLLSPNRVRSRMRGIKWLLGCMVGMLCVSIVGNLLNGGESIALWLWSIRNYFRFYVFWVGCICWLEQNDVKLLLDWFVKLLYINFVVCSIQYFLFDYKMDFLGGTFGMDHGCNAYMNILLCVTFTWVLICYVRKQCELSKLLAVMGICIYIAALSELKIFFVEMILVICITLIYRASLPRKIIVLLTSIVGAYIGVQVLIHVFPFWGDYFTIASILEDVSSSYSNLEGGLSRTTAIPVLSSLFHDNVSKTLFGIGMGSAEVSNIAVFNTETARQFDRVLHYSWFSYTFLFLEGGAVGTFVYTTFFLLCERHARKHHIYAIRRKDTMAPAETYAFDDQCLLAQIIALMCIVWMFYNSALRLDTGYFVYFILAIPFITNTRKRTNNYTSMKK